MPDYDQFQVGAVVEPLPDISNGHSLLQDADPALFYLLEFLTYIIRTYPGPRLMQEVAALANVGIDGVSVTNPVEQAYPIDPKPEFLENQVQFPLLFAFRTTGQSEQWTVGSDHDVCGVTAIYVLPPLDAAQAEKLYPILHAVFKAVRKGVTYASDPGYTPTGGNAGDQFTAREFGNLEEVGFGSPPVDRRVASVSTGFEFGSLPGMKDSLWFPCVIMRGYMIERDEFNPRIGGLDPFEGLDLTGNLKADDGTIVPATSTTVVQASTGLPPSVTSLSVATGPASGGTSVTVTGANFLSGPPVVFFGPVDRPTYAASVSFVSSTSIAFTTPAMQGAGPVDVTITNRDGQSVTLPRAFTFT